MAGGCGMVKFGRSGGEVDRRRWRRQPLLWRGRLFCPHGGRIRHTATDRLRPHSGWHIVQLVVHVGTAVFVLNVRIPAVERFALASVAGLAARAADLCEGAL